MRFLSKAEALEWLQARGLVLKSGDLSTGDPVATFDIPVDAGRKTALAATLVRLLRDEPDWMLLIDEYGIFPSCEDMFLLDTFRGALGATQPVWEKPGHLFDSNDLRAAQSLLGLTLYFFWGGLLVCGSGSVVVRLSHDEWLGLGGREPAVSWVAASLQEFFAASAGPKPSGQ